jgi:hypothetical protein
MKTYELNVYHDINNHGYLIVSKTFYSMSELLMYCTDFETDNMLFDVFIPEDKAQYNVNMDVELIKKSIDNLTSEGEG